MAEEHCAKRPHQICDGEPAKREEKRPAPAAVEDPGEYRREIKIEREIVPFDDGRKGRDAERMRRKHRIVGHVDDFSRGCGARSHPDGLARPWSAAINARAQTASASL